MFDEYIGYITSIASKAQTNRDNAERELRILEMKSNYNTNTEELKELDKKHNETMQQVKTMGKITYILFNTLQELQNAKKEYEKDNQ